MRSRRPSPEHADAVARRLAELSAQLAAAREHDHEEVRDLDPAVGDEWWADHTHVALRPALSVVPPMPDPPEPRPEPEPEPEPEPVALPAPALPVPGRHAARRPAAWVAALRPDPVPAALRGRVGLAGPQLTAVAVLVATGLALTCWWVVRGDPAAPEPVTVRTAAGTALGAAVEALPPGGSPSADPPVAAPGEAPAVAPTGTVTVDVAGRVRRPGIVVLDAGARVVDALERAGGARPGVDLTPLNLARLLVDGEQVVVGAQAGVGAPGVPVAPPPAPGAATSTTPGVPPVLVDLNLADQAQLETLPQVGPVTATAIIAWRTENGGFTSVTELLEVSGIGDATLAELTPHVTV